MSPQDAARLLEIPAHATPAQIEARFVELRASLEEKIGKALTPGLQEKYRASLAEVTQAYETLVLAAESASIPGLSGIPSSAATPAPKLPPLPPASSAAMPKLPPLPVLPPVPPPSMQPTAFVPPPAPPVTPAAPSAAPKKSSAGKFVGLTIVAVLALGAGGWWFIQQRAEQAEKARLEEIRQAELARQRAEEQKRLDAEEKARVAAAEKVRREQQDKVIAGLRARLTELNTSGDLVLRAEQNAERELAGLKTRAEELAAAGQPASSPALRLVTAQIQATEELITWLRKTLPTHPVRTARTKTADLLIARSVDAATASLDNYTAMLAQLRTDIAATRRRLDVSAPVSLSANLDGATWQLTDAFGLVRSGNAPAQLDGVAIGKATVTFKHEGWPDLVMSVGVSSGDMTKAAGVFPVGSAVVTTTPAGAQIFQGQQLLGTTPLNLPQLPPGNLELRYVLKGYKGGKIASRVESGKNLPLAVTLQAARSSDLDFVLEQIRENLPLVNDPDQRVNALSGIAYVAGRLAGVPKEMTAFLLDAQLEAFRAVADPKKRITTAAIYVSMMARVDFERSRKLAEETVPLFAQLTGKEDRQNVAFYADNFALHPEPGGKIAVIVAGWYPSREDWAWAGNTVELLSRLGKDAEARQLVSRMSDPAGGADDIQNKSLRDHLAAGLATRQYLPVKQALLRQDLPAAQQALARVNAKLDFGGLYDLATDFMTLGDFETPVRLAGLAESEYFSKAQAMSSLAIHASSIGNFAKAESWIAALPDTAEKPTRSQAYRSLAERYLILGMLPEARTAAGKIALVDASQYSTDPQETARIFLETGLADRARQYAGATRIPFDKDNVSKLTAAVPLFQIQGDKASFDRALEVIRANNAQTVDIALYYTVLALCRMNRLEEAEKLQAQIREATWLNATASSLISKRLQKASESEADALLEKSQPGYHRLLVLSGLLGQQLQKQDFARYGQAAP